MADSPSDRIVRALAQAVAGTKPQQPYVMEPTILGNGGSLPSNAYFSDSGEVVDQNFRPYPVVRRPGMLPFAKTPEGNLTPVMPRLMDALMLGWMSPRPGPFLTITDAARQSANQRYVGMQVVPPPDLRRGRDWDAEP